MFKHLLVGIDGRAGGRDAIALAKLLAVSPARMTLAHLDGTDWLGALNRERLPAPAPA